ncbi:kinesin-like protein KIF12 isoform X2 [Pocillopora verrucosa]|uniref:kinesin-like protein KIF12 isoform X2 n=1 Tax=Pocillopora verrucosa TaxID=203993 RepID=UPI003342ABF1
MAKSHEMEQLNSDDYRRNRGELNPNSAEDRSPPFYDSDSPSGTPSVNSAASQSTSARSSRSSTLGSGLSTRSATTTGSDGEIEALDNVRVVARARPLNLAERERGDKNVLKLPGDGAVWIDNSFGQIKPFTFNAAFGEETSQQDMFKGCGIKHLVEMSVQGYSCTAFAYGQTGSGKTYTITGPLNQEDTVHMDSFIPDPDMQGLIERSFQYLFELMDSSADVEYTLKASYLEVYNEKVQDLLNPSSARDSLPVRWARDRGFYVENLFFVECDTVDDLSAVLEEGLRNRHVGSHLMNDHSSRSHTMLTVYIDIESKDPEDESGYPVIKHGKLSLVDLAGSERVKETKSVGGTFTESQNINKSLLTLGNCISALSDQRKKSGHIPYRDSKLTKLLADSLGGDGITLMIACISPSSYVVQDTLNTLRYAHRAKRIKNKPVVHMDPKEKLILSLKREIKLLRTENAYFRQQLGIPSSDSQTSLTSYESKTTIVTEDGSTPKLNDPSLNEGKLKPGEDSQRLTTAFMAAGANSGLYDMLQEYMLENENLRTRNVELVQSREEVSRQQMVLSRENDRLSKKLEELERVIVSSPMSLRTLSGVESLRGVERTSSLPEERFMSTIPVHSARAHPSQFASELQPGHFERRNSLPTQSKDRRRSASDLPPNFGPTRFPPIQDGPYPNYVGQGGWRQVPEAQAMPQEVIPVSNRVHQRAPQARTTSDPPSKQKSTASTKKRSVSTSDRPQKAGNSYARMFAVQKEKKAKEAKENEGKNPQSNDANQKTAAMENRNPQILVDGMNYNSQPNGGGPVENDMQLGYNPALAEHRQLAERTRQELQQLDSQIEYHRFMTQNRYNNNPPR